MSHEPVPLRSADPSGYGEHYRSHMFDQYRLYIELMDRVSQRRATANNWFLGINAFLISLYGLAPDVGRGDVWQLGIPAAGMLVSIAWWLLIRSYRSLNAIKCTLLHEIEEFLPLNLFSREWDLAELGSGRRHTPLTNIEQWIPLIFVLLFVLLLALPLFD